MLFKDFFLELGVTPP